MAQQLVDLVEQFCHFQRKQRGKTEGGVRTYRWNPSSWNSRGFRNNGINPTTDLPRSLWSVSWATTRVFPTRCGRIDSLAV